MRNRELASTNMILAIEDQLFAHNISGNLKLTPSSYRDFGLPSSEGRFLLCADD